MFPVYFEWRIAIVTRYFVSNHTLHSDLKKYRIQNNVYCWFQTTVLSNQLLYTLLINTYLVFTHWHIWLFFSSRFFFNFKCFRRCFNSCRTILIDNYGRTTDIRDLNIPPFKTGSPRVFRFKQGMCCFTIDNLNFFWKQFLEWKRCSDNQSLFTKIGLDHNSQTIVLPK